MHAHPLDNPVWYSLSETHASLAIDYGGVQFYDPDYCPFGAFMAEGADTASALSAYAQKSDPFFVVGERPVFRPPLRLKHELICLQMVIDQTLPLFPGPEIVELNPDRHEALFELVNLVQPGYFRSKTACLGRYYGIFQHERLVAAAGERMQTNAWTEISAVVTHPEYTGRGYARRLVAHAVNAVFRQSKMPFLHVAASNQRAIRVYEQSGFYTRRNMTFWQITAQ